MSLTESQIQALILRELTADPAVRLFRNLTALGYGGKLVGRENGCAIVKPGYPLHAGLHVGSADLIGWSSGRFLSLEIKTPDGRATPEQVHWLNNVRMAGGIAAIVSSVDEARAALSP